MALDKSILKEFEDETGHRLVNKGDYYQIYKKPGPSSKTFKNNAAFQKAWKQNLSFFKLVAIASAFRKAMVDIVEDIKDKKFGSNTVKFSYQLLRGVNYIFVSKEGAKREQEYVIKADSFKDFNFYDGHPLKYMLKVDPKVVDGAVIFNDFVAFRDLNFPILATHAEISVAKCDVHLEKGIDFDVVSKTKTVLLNDRSRNLQFTFQMHDKRKAVSLFIIQITFLNQKIRLAMPEWRAMGVVGC